MVDEPRNQTSVMYTPDERDTRIRFHASLFFESNAVPCLGELLIASDKSMSIEFQKTRPSTIESMCHVSPPTRWTNRCAEDERVIGEFLFIGQRFVFRL